MRSRKGQVSAINDLIAPILIVVLIGVSFSIIISSFGTNYDLPIEDDSYAQIVNLSADMSEASQSMTEALVGTNQTQTNVLTSVERLSTGAYNSILIFSRIPGFYVIILNSISNSLGIPDRIVNMILISIVFSIVGVLLYLILGRR